jgi:predicted component of type VI protein secretion system
MSGIERKNFLNIQFFLALNGTSVTVSYPCSISIWGDFSFSRKEEKNLNWR